MGNSLYSFSDRAKRSNSLNYHAASMDELFEQNRKKRIHESMSPANVVIRESRDSDNHPLTVPIILALDVTGSMGRIPHSLLKEGLPKMVGRLMELGVKDPAIMIMAVGDALCDNYPMQVGQFESGDAELDMWLQRTYIEGNGGGNGGESYSLAWYFAANHTVTDAWEKRHMKGIIITIGDEPCHNVLPKNAISGLMKESAMTNTSGTIEELLASAQERWHVFHLNVLEGHRGHSSLDGWRHILGENCIAVEDHTHIPETIAELVAKSYPPSLFDTSGVQAINESTPETDSPLSGESEEEIL